jgi:hypothetical protein
MFRQISTAWLRSPPHILDVAAVLLVGTGVNLFTSSFGGGQDLRLLSSGLLVSASGALVAALRHHSTLIWFTVEKKQQAEADAFERYLRKPDGGPQPTFKGLETHLSETVDDYLDHVKESAPFRGLLLSAMATFCLGLSLGLWQFIQAYKSPNGDMKLPLGAIEEDIRSIHNEIVTEESQTASRFSDLAREIARVVNATDDLRAGRLLALAAPLPEVKKDIAIIKLPLRKANSKHPKPISGRR